MDIIQGSLRKIYKSFLRFIAEIERINPGSEVDLVLVLNSTHNSSRFKGILLAIIAVDADNHIFPIAFGMAELECAMSWTWFYGLLHGAVGNTPNLIFISNDHLGIKAALKLHFLECGRRLCSLHM